METDGASSGANHVDRPAASETETVVRTFLIADVRGYTSFTHAHGDEAAGELAARFASLAREAVTSTGGEVIELRGDEALCVFHSARRALRAAVEMQIRFRQRAEGALILLAGIAAAAVALTRGGSGATSGSPSVAPDSLAAVDPKANTIIGEVRIPGGPSLVAAGGRFVWVASDASRTISAISADKQAVTHVVAPDATPSALAADGDAVWVLDGNRRRLLKIDPTYGVATRRIALPRAPPQPVTNRRLSSLSVFAG